MAQILDGKALARRIRAQLKDEVADLTARLGRPPGLAVVVVGEDPGSAVYVHNKEVAAAEVGMLSRIVRLPASASEAEILAAIDDLNADGSIDGFIVQLPLPGGVDSSVALARIAPDKDADGIHPYNLGRLLAGMPGPRPCTPLGILKLIDEAGVDLCGKRAVVLGRSVIVGKPVGQMLLERHATVTLCHSRTRDLAEEVRRAEIVVAAVGQPRLVQGDWIAPGAVVVDVGTSRVEGKLVGDVDFAAAEKRAKAITPVPGGVGPMTVAMLLCNTVEAARRRLGKAKR
jgi:methylenetetrahydrofolate dehydrogenase (NADP+) / methenyltetrahydrofolate cyclohydrolase